MVVRIFRIELIIVYFRSRFMKTSRKVSLILIVAIISLIIALPSSAKKSVSDSAPFLKFLTDQKVNLGLDLQGGTQLTYRVDTSLVDEKDKQNIINGVEDVLRGRVDGLGVSEPQIYQAEFGAEKHIVVELAGVKDIDEAKQKVGKTVQLDFREQGNQDLSDSDKARIKEAAQNSLNTLKSTQSGSFESIFQSLKKADLPATYSKPEGYMSTFMQSIDDQEVRKKIFNSAPGALYPDLVHGIELQSSEGGGMSVIDNYQIIKVLSAKEELRRDPTDAEPFDKVVKELSSDAAKSAIGFRKKDQLGTMGDEVMKRAKGEVTDIVEDTTGFYIYKLTDKPAKDAELAHIAYLFYPAQSLDEAKKTGEKVDVRHILIGFKGRTEDEAKKLAEDVKAKLVKNPKDFDKLAKEYSDDTGSKDKGGLYQGVVRGQMVKEFEDAAFGNPLNQISEPVKTEFGYHIVQTVAKKNIDEKAIEAARTKAKDQATKDLAELSKDSQKFFENAPKKADTKTAVFQDAGFIPKEVNEPVYTVVAPLKPLEVSGIIESKDGIYIAQLLDKKEKGQDVAKLEVMRTCWTGVVDCPKAYKDRDEAKTMIATAEKRIRTEKKASLELINFSMAPQPWVPAKVNGEALTGKHFKRADLTFDSIGNPVVQITFKDEGIELFKEITKRNIQKPLAIFLDDRPVIKTIPGCVFEVTKGSDFVCPVYSPTVQAEITDGVATITGTRNMTEASELVRNLNTGAIPAPVSLVGQEVVNATLGQDALNKSIKAGILGLILVMLFMLVLYRLPGIIADIALGFYLLLMVAAVKLLGVTMTLAGVAGLIITIGMAVDSNILIFARLKEELMAGKPITQAVNAAFSRAWSSIWDSHVTIIVSCLILAYFGTSIVRGFAIMLMIGLVLNLFTANYTSQTLLGLIARKKWGKKWIAAIAPKHMRADLEK